MGLLTEFIWGFPKIRGTILRAPIIRSIVFWVLYWGPPGLLTEFIWGIVKIMVPFWVP